MEYYGLSLSIPSFTGDFAPSKVEDVLTAVWHAILAKVDSVFSNILNDIQTPGKDVLQFADEVVDDIFQLLTRVVTTSSRTWTR